jgi:hypothetical protein
MSSGTVSVTSSPGPSEPGDAITAVNDSLTSSNYSVKAEAAQMLGIPLHEGDKTADDDKPFFVRQVYGVLVENWEAWSTILRLIKARSTTLQVPSSVFSSCCLAQVSNMFTAECRSGSSYCTHYAI